MRTRPLPRNFSSGELAPWVDGITNELTQKGCRTLENFIVKKQGQAIRRPGSYFVAEVKDSSKATAIVPVVIDDTNRYVLEIGDAYIRFYAQSTHSQIASSGTAYEITSPWSTGDISDLRWQYIPSEKSVVFSNVSGAYALQRLKWTSDTSWSLKAHGIMAADRVIAIQNRGITIHSEDFINWERDGAFLSLNTPLQQAQVFTGRDAIFVVGTTLSGAVSHVFRSEDGESWMDVTPATSGKSIVGGAGNELGEIVVCGQSGTIYASYDDGITWNSMTPPAGATTGWETVVYDNSVNAWRMAGTDINAYSRDAYTWTSIADISGGQNVLAMQSHNDIWIGVGSTTYGGNSGTILYASSFASPWTVAFSNITADYFTKFHSVEYGEPNGTSLWVAITSNNGWVYTSSNGQVWARNGTTITDLSNTSSGALLWLRTKFVYVASTSVASPDTYIWESTNGLTFTRQTGTLMEIYGNQGWGGIAIMNHTDFEWFSSTNHYPKNLTYHEDRLVIGPTDNEPSTLYGSETGNIYKFALGDTSEKAFKYELTGQGNVDIQWFMGNMGGLVVGTRTAEGILLGSQEEGITPLTAQFRWLSTFGSANIQPVRIHDTIVFVQRGGEIIRGYVPSQQSYQSPELTAYADHIASGGVTKLAHQDDPQSMVYAIRNDGQMPALTFDNNLRAWSRIKAAPSLSGTAVIEDMAIIPTSNAEDEIWLLTNRTIGGSTKRYIEYMDTLAVASFAAAHYVDCGVYKTSGTTFQTIGSLTHLAGENVDAFISAPAANIRWLSALTVAASGTITTAPYSGTNIHVGLPYASYLQTLRGDYGSEYGDGAGLNKRTSGLTLWVHDSSALAKFGPTTTAATESITYSTSVALATEVVSYPFPGQWDRDGYIWCIVTDPRPFTLVAILPDSETGSR